jgi:predicted nuclease of restriction endonuclease-like (RecB) superfamily
MPVFYTARIEKLTNLQQPVGDLDSEILLQRESLQIWQKKQAKIIGRQNFGKIERIFKRFWVSGGSIMIKNDAKTPATASFYKDLLTEIKSRVRKAQNRLATIANTELLGLYWDIGGLLVNRQKLEGWGAGVLRRLATDLKNELSHQQGYSERNLKLMTQFFREYPGLFEIGQQPVADIHALVRALSWTVNILLIQKVKDLEFRKYYMHACIEQGWGRDILAVMIKSNAHERQGAAVTNFDTQLPQPHAQLAKDTLKDPYIFDFLTLDKPIGISEYELTRALPEELKSALPTIEEIEAELSADLQDENEGNV